MEEHKQVQSGRRMHRKAQIQIMENAFALLTIFIILIIAVVFVFVLQRNEQIQREKEFADLAILKKSWILNFLPEMQCSTNLNIEPDCYDLLKIDAFAKKLEDQKISGDTYYASLLGNVRIRVEWFDPSPDVNKEMKTWVIYDNPKKADNGFKPIPLPVTLRDPVNHYDYFGVVYLEAYQ